MPSASVVCVEDCFRGVNQRTHLWVGLFLYSIQYRRSPSCLGRRPHTCLKDHDEMYFLASLHTIAATLLKHHTSLTYFDLAPVSWGGTVSSNKKGKDGSCEIVLTSAVVNGKTSYRAFRAYRNDDFKSWDGCFVDGETQASVSVPATCNGAEQVFIARDDIVYAFLYNVYLWCWGQCISVALE